MEIIGQVVGDPFVRSRGDIVNVNVGLTAVYTRDDQFQAVVGIGKVEDLFVIQEYPGGVLIIIDIISRHPQLAFLLFEKRQDPARGMPCQDGIGIILDLFDLVTFLLNFLFLAGAQYRKGRSSPVPVHW